MLEGKAVVASKVGGITDIVDEKVGFFVQQKKPKQLSQKILKIKNNKALAKKLGNAGQKKAKQKFNWKNIAKEYETIYKRLLK